MVTDKQLSQMDEQADKIIAGWSFGALAANLLPPPFDMIAVSAVFAKLGRAIGKVYGISLSWNVLVDLSKSIMKAISAVAAAAYVGTSLFKYVPGVNLWVALLIQPPIVGAIAYTVGNAFKKYYRIKITEGRDLSKDEIQNLAQGYLRSKL